MRNECYQTKRGLTAEQLAYDAMWERAKKIYQGLIVMPWLFLGFSPKPRAEHRAGEHRPVYRANPFTRASRFVAPENVDVHVLSVKPESAQRLRRGKQVIFEAAIFSARGDDHGLPLVDSELLHKTIDMAMSPRQDHPVCALLDMRGQLKYSGRAGQFRIVDNGLWVDLCVGTTLGSDTPTVIYRIPANDINEVVFTKERWIESGSTLATLKQDMRIGVAQFEPNGMPKIDHELNHNPSATRAVPRLRMYINALTNMIDLTLNPPDQRPAIVPLGRTAPAVCYKLDPVAAPFLSTSPGYEHTDFLLDRVIEAIGPRGDFHVNAQHSGVIGMLLPSAAQPHMVRLQIGFKTQLFPKTAVLLDGIEPGMIVEKGQPIADFCPRLVYARQDLFSILEDNYEFLMEEFLRQQMIQPGQDNWQGPEVLIDKRYLCDSLIKPDMEWVFDFAPCMPYLHATDGYFALPVFPSQDELSFTVNGLTVNYDTENGPKPRSQQPRRPAKRVRKKARNSERQRETVAIAAEPEENFAQVVDCVATRMQQIAEGNPTSDDFYRG